MLNVILAVVAVLVWSLSYAIYFWRDLRRWWRDRDRRRAERQAARERALRFYAAWVRDIPPGRPRHPSLPIVMPEPIAAPVATPPVRTGQVVPFPARRAAGRR